MCVVWFGLSVLVVVFVLTVSFGLIDVCVLYWQFLAVRVVLFVLCVVFGVSVLVVWIVWCV